MSNNTLHMAAEVGADRRLVIDLPPDFPLGSVDLEIRPTTPTLPSDQPLTREEAGRRLLAAGLLSTEHYAPEGAVRSSADEAERLAKLLTDPNQSIVDLINTDREDRA